jgi:hypothetical protein
MIASSWLVGRDVQCHGPRSRWYGHIGRSICAIAIVFLVLESIAVADVLEQRRRECPGGGFETWTLFEDNCDGGIYTLYVDCDGKHHWNVPRPDWRIVASAGGISVYYPPDFWTMLHMADFAAPAADVVWVVNAGTGERVYFRNPIDHAEQQKIIDAWTCAQLN